jgi:hypothetical protein
MIFKLLYMCMRTSEPGTGLKDWALDVCEGKLQAFSSLALKSGHFHTINALLSRNVLPPHTLHGRSDISQNLSTSYTGNGSADHIPCLLQGRKVHDTIEGHIKF